MDISGFSCFTQSDVTGSWAEASEISVNDNDVTEITDFDTSATTSDTPFKSTPIGRTPIALFKRKRGESLKAESDISESGSSDIAHEGKKSKSQNVIQTSGEHSSDEVV